MLFRQLLLLLWKNFSLRKRQPFRNAVEIFWPLALFLILVLVRQRRGPKPIAATFSKPKALPTAGTLPFLQSFFCNFNSGQYNVSQGLPDYSKSHVYKFIGDLQPILQNRTQLELIDRLPQDWLLIQEDLRELQSNFNISSNSTLRPDMSINELLTPDSQIEIKNFLTSTTSLNDTLIDSFMHSRLNVEKIFSLYGQYVGGSSSIWLLPFEITKMICNTTEGLNNLVIIPKKENSVIVQKQLCELSTSNWRTLLMDFQGGLNATSLIKYVKNAERYRETLEKLQVEVLRFRDDIASLKSFEGVIDDVRLMLNQSSTNGSSFNDVVCGRSPSDDQDKSKKKADSGRTLYTQIKDAAASQAHDPASSTDTCLSLKPSKRSDCGWPGISKGTCLTMGCCFDSSVPFAKYCFCKPGHQQCCAVFNSFIYLISGVSGEAGESSDSTSFKSLMSMILKGKVLYTPDTPQTRAVIEKVNSFILNIRDAIYSVRRLKTPIKRILNFTDQYLPLVNMASENASPESQASFAFFQSYFKQQLDIRMDDFSIDDLVSLRNQSGTIFELIDMVDTLLTCYNLSTYFVPVENEQELVKMATDPKPGQPFFLSSIVFLNLNAKDGSFPKKIEYKIRLNPDFTPTTLRVARKYWRPGPNNWKRYIRFGYVYLQDLVERAIVDVVINKTVQQPGLFAEEFPYPCYLSDQFAYVTSNAMPLFMTLAWVYSVAMIVKSIVLEKERRLKEVMKVMGLSSSVYWMSWFITSFIMMLLSIILNVSLLKFGSVLKNSDPLIVLWLLSVFAVASIMLCFLISVFFSRANVAAACGGIIYFFTYLPYTLTIYFENEISYDQKNVLSLFSTTAFGVACRYMARYEEQGVGIQWENYFKSPLPGDEHSFGVAVNMLILDSFLYLALMWYFENVIPGQYGIPRPWYFLLTKSYWFGSNGCTKALRSCQRKVGDHYRYQVEMSNVEDVSEDQERDPELFETDPRLPLGVNIKGLVKIYSRGKKLAVDNLYLKLYEGQVTALLGHNGAGKSTTMSILTGLFPPTEGTAEIYGDDIRYDIESIRRSIGMCPQHNVLFDELTVEEHMWFYARLKGMSNIDIRHETEKFMKDVGLQDKQKELSCNLSGGMKRKLSVALAFIAKAKTIILDEPTAGVDPYSRRSIWDLILKYKADRTILLSTHYMDEADLLGDRISIISNGRLQCCGSSLFLKRYFGDGYYLTIVKDTTEGAVFDGHQLLEFICKVVPGSFLKDDVGSEACFVLPLSGRQEGKFELLFQELEQNLKEFGIKSYGISDTSLEEVFLKACNEEKGTGDEDNVSLTGPVQRRLTQRYDYNDTESLLSNESNDYNGTAARLSGNSPGDIPNPKTGVQLLLRQFAALIIKRFHHARRSKKGFFSQILLPAVFVIASMSVSLLRPPRIALPALKLTPSQYGQPNYIFVSNEMKSDLFAKNLTEALIQRPGVGTECMAPKACSSLNNTYPFAPLTSLWNRRSRLSQCPCPGGIQKCSSRNYGKAPPTETIHTMDTIIDLTGRDITQYLLTTMSQFIQKRYGGVSFGEVSRFYPRLMPNLTQNNFISNYGVQENARVWYNPKGYHALPTYINVVNNAILRANLPLSSDPAEYGIVAYNHPMEYNREQLGEETLMQGFTDLMVAIFVIIALSFVPASFVVYLVNDRETKSKHIQFVGGLRPYVYWIATYTWDVVNYIIPATCCIIIFLAFNQKAYVSTENFPATVVLLLLYGWSMTPLMYPSSFYFEVPSTAYIVLICLNLFVGIVGTIATFILELFRDDEELTSINNILKQVFLIFPNYCLGRGLMDLARNQFVSDIYSRFGESTFRSPFAWTEIGRNVFSMFVGGIAFFALTLLIEYRFFCSPKRSDPNTFVANDEEEDVAAERQNVSEINEDDDDLALRTNDLTKVYSRNFGKRKTLAVNRLSFGVKKGECFGLLGVNGAGKTSTFKMLTGDTHVSAGDAFINGHSTLKDLHTAHRYMGYCPQFDALDDLLTARETLKYFARIRGATGKDVAEIADWAISMLGLTSYADKIAGDYSGGNKRKLSTAIALIGNPPVILLDEPTTGMDPGARRFLWDLISSIVEQGRSVVFTSHSMEECEVLCNRIGIMVNGKFMCLGSPQHLRSKYGDGYTLLLRAHVQHVQDCKDFVEANFPNASLKDCHYNMLEYQVPSVGLLLSQVFAKLELLQATSSMEDYSVTQTTLDQIFVNFARKQIESVAVDIGPIAASVDV